MESLILFLVVNNTQLYNAINIKMTMYEDMSADLCLCGDWSKKGLYERLVDSKIFKNVFIHKDKYDGDQSIKGKVRKAVSYLSSDSRLQEKLSFLPQYYNSLFLSGPSMTSIEVYYYLKKRCTIKLNIFEEGIFEYYMYSYKQNMPRRIYSKIIFRSFYLDDCKDVYVYDKTLILNVPNDVTLHSIPKPCSTKLISLMNDIFQFKSDNVEEFRICQFLYLEQEFPTMEENERQKEIIRNLYGLIGARLLVKLHPRSKVDKYCDVGVMAVKTKSSMELIEMNLQINPQIVFTINSSAVFNFYSIFHCESKVVFLYKIFDSVTIDDSFEFYMKNFKCKYGNSSVYVPESKEELLNCIQGDINASSV